MKDQSGRSLIEIIGVMAIAGVLTAGAVMTYNIIRNRQTRTIAMAGLENIAKNTRLLMAARDDYNGVSVDYLIKAGALKNNKAPIGGADWSITPSIDGHEFMINLTELSRGDCEYFTTVRMEWVMTIKVNGYESGAGTYCLSTGDNDISLVIE